MVDHLYPNNHALADAVFDLRLSDGDFGGILGALVTGFGDSNAAEFESLFHYVHEVRSDLVEGTPAGRLVYMKSNGRAALAIKEAANPEKARVIGITQEEAPAPGQTIRIVTWGRARYYHGGSLGSGAAPYKLYVPDENGTGHEAGIVTRDSDSGIQCGIWLSPGDWIRVWPCVQQ